MHKSKAVPDNNVSIPAYITHMSFETPTVSVIKHLEGSLYVVTCSKPVINIITGDPVVCKFFENGSEHVLTGETVKIVDQYTVKILISSSQRYKDSRRHIRYAVSVSSVIAGVDSLEYYCSTTKSISSSGLALNCKEDYSFHQLVNVSVVISSEEAINLVGKIVRKTKVLDYFEYGIEINFIDAANKEKLSKYIVKLDEDEKAFISGFNNPA